MLCPACGTSATIDQQFCRVCGLNLEVIGKLVADHSAGSDEMQTKIDRAEVERAIAQRIVTWMTLGLILIGFGVVLFLIDEPLDLPKPFETLTPLILLSGIGIAIAGLVNGIRQGFQLSSKQPSTQSLQQPNQQALPTHRFEQQVSSIAE
jgi:hypothetical protein